MRKGVFNTIDDYDITEEGNVINKKTGRILKPQPNSKGYLRIQLTNKEKYFVHRLVASKYIPNPNNLPQVNHIDGNKLNNRASNLEWISNIDNRAHAIRTELHLCGDKCSWAKLTSDTVRLIRSDTIHTTKELSIIYNVSPATIRDIMSRRTWKHLK